MDCLGKLGCIPNWSQQLAYVSWLHCRGFWASPSLCEIKLILGRMKCGIICPWKSWTFIATFQTKTNASHVSRRSEMGQARESICQPLSSAVLTVNVCLALNVSCVRELNLSQIWGLEEGEKIFLRGGLRHMRLGFIALASACCSSNCQDLPFVCMA